MSSESSAHHDSITCKQLIDFLDDYLAGTQAAATRQEFERHLAHCKACVDYVRMYEEAVRLGKAAFKADPSAAAPASVPEDLVKAVLAAVKKRP